MFKKKSGICILVGFGPRYHPLFSYTCFTDHSLYMFYRPLLVHVLQTTPCSFVSIFITLPQKRSYTWLYPQVYYSIYSYFLFCVLFIIKHHSNKGLFFLSVCPPQFVPRFVSFYLWPPLTLLTPFMNWFCTFLLTFLPPPFVCHSNKKRVPVCCWMVRILPSMFRNSWIVIATRKQCTWLKPFLSFTRGEMSAFV